MIEQGIYTYTDPLGHFIGFTYPKIHITSPSASTQNGNWVVDEDGDPICLPEELSSDDNDANSR